MAATLSGTTIATRCRNWRNRMAMLLRNEWRWTKEKVAGATRSMQDARQELTSARRARTVEEVFLRVVFNNRAAVHEHDPIGDAPREAHFVSHAQHRHAVLRKL